METIENTVKSDDSLIFNEDIKEFLLETSKWAKFLSILGFIGLGFMVIAALVMLAMGSSIGRYSSFGSGVGIIALVYFILAGVYFFPVYYLFQASTGIRDGIDDTDQDSLTSGFEHLKSHYKFMGIAAIVIITLYLLIFIFGLLAVSMF